MLAVRKVTASAPRARYSPCATDWGRCVGRCAVDDMTWMSSFYELPLQPSHGQPVRAFWLAAALLMAAGCGGVVLATCSQAAAPASIAAADAGPAL